jgi:hypothetical protein
MLQVDPIQSNLNLKIGLPPVLKAGSSGSLYFSAQKIARKEITSNYSHLTRFITAG